MNNIIFLCGLILLNTINGNAETPAYFEKNIHSKVLETISSSETIPGLKDTEFSALKGAISRLWETLVEEGAIEISGTDKNVRPLFVALQGAVSSYLEEQGVNVLTFDFDDDTQKEICS